ncbi:hypothetical protein [Chitinimonas sp.]|uniref:hypothetical protein n=1 Tax=Chitinimonas sp. TaxID=1934313 RepID=UPI0035B40032
MSAWRAALAALIMLAFGGCAFAQPLFASRHLPAGEQRLPALFRDALVQPARYRVVVIPGSGCAGMAPIADRYFAGLLHASVLVLHKPGVDVAAWPAPPRCSAGFVQQDDLAEWQQLAAKALRQQLAQASSDLPVVLVGISEGAELLPALARELPEVKALVIISHAGLDPAELAGLQAERLGASAAWQKVQTAVASERPDSVVMQGRSLRYWRSLLSWRLQQPLLASPLPLLQAWGEHDALLPPDAYLGFAKAAQQRAAPYCALAIPGADHGLQTDAGDQLPLVWARLELRAKGLDWCVH